MIQNPILLFLTLGLVVFAVLCCSKIQATKKFFKFLPVPLWCYFIPTVFSTIGLTPSDSPLYGNMSRTILPACLFLLLVGTDLPSIYKLSRKSLLAMIAGAVGILLGGFVTFTIILKFYSPENFQNYNELWKGWGCLSATWTGGSANMISVKEILQTPELIFSNLIIVDTIVAYSWMAFLVFLSKYQDAINRTLRFSDIPEAVPEIEEENQQGVPVNIAKKIQFRLLLAILAFTAGYLCWFFAGTMPSLSAVINRMTWTVIFATAIPLLLSATSAQKLENYGAGRTGNILLFLMLTSFGARADLANLVSSPIFLCLGILWVMIHGIVLIVAGKIFKIPIALLATASQANVGGPISAPIVASVYRKNLASVGVILAVLGNIFGTYVGLFASEICKRLSDIL